MTPTMMYGAAMNAPCAKPTPKRQIIKIGRFGANAMPTPHSTQTIPAMTTIRLRPKISPSLPPIGVMMVMPIEEKMENRPT